MGLAWCAYPILVNEAELASAAFKHHGTIKHDKMALAHQNDQVLEVDQREV